MNLQHRENEIFYIKDEKKDFLERCESEFI